MLSLQHPRSPNTAEDSRVVAPLACSQNKTIFFSCEGKHFTVLDTDSHSLEGHSPWRFEPVLMGLHRSGHYQPRLEMLLGLSR